MIFFGRPWTPPPLPWMTNRGVRAVTTEQFIQVERRKEFSLIAWAARLPLAKASWNAHPKSFPQENQSDIINSKKEVPSALAFPGFCLSACAPEKKEPRDGELVVACAPAQDANEPLSYGIDVRAAGHISAALEEILEGATT
jgi:hypothetical protein